MERITRRIGESIDFVDGKGYAKLSHEESTRLLFERLAEYEDIGIEPEKLKEFLGNFGISIVMKNTKLMNELQENKEIISKMAKRLKSFEENTFNSGWIPVNKELPEYNKHVLLYLKNDEGKETQVVGYLYFSKNKHLEVGNNNFSVYAGSDMPDFLIKEYVKAWKPLPEPYKEELL